MKRTTLCLMGLLLMLTTAVSAQPALLSEDVLHEALGEQIICDGEVLSENAVVFTVIQMRPNSNYTATAVGLNGFDPVLAVVDAESGEGLCNDDNADAHYYEADLPTTGPVTASNTTASQAFNTNNYTEMANIEIRVGGFNSQPGEFILIIEGMLLSQADGEGDPIALTISPGMMLAEINPSVYMLSVVAALDPLIAMIDSEYEFIVDDDGAYVYCDDAGDEATCWGDSSSVIGSFVSRSQGRSLSGAGTDAMLTLPITEEVIGVNYITLMRSYEMRTFGDYVVVYHVGIGEVTEKEEE